MNEGKVIWFTGLSGSGKSTLSKQLKIELESRGINTILLDGDTLRQGLNRDLGFSPADRLENLRRAAEMALILIKEGYTVIAAFITPLESIRKHIRGLFSEGAFLEVFLDCPLCECENRDPKGMYVRARKGEIPEFTGISAPFDPPGAPDIIIPTHIHSVQQSIGAIISLLDRPLRLVKSSPAVIRNKKRRIAVLGLDCVPSNLVFGEYAELMPHISCLAQHGMWGNLRSTDPPITVPAWTTITTGKDPGELGLYGFRNRSKSDYQLSIADSTRIKAERVWDYIEDSGGRSVLIGIPQTYPAKPHNGITVGDFLAPGVDSRFTYPAEISEQLESICGGAYLPDVKGFRTENKDKLLRDIYTMLDRRFKLAAEFLTQRPWDFFMMVEIASDRIHHGFWRFCRSDHRLHVPDNPFENVMPDFYRYLDSKIGSLLMLLDDDTTVVTLSDHGAKSMQGSVCINEWLIQNGYLKLRGRPEPGTPLTADLVDWSATRAWGEGGYYARIFLNLQGREPSGIVAPNQYEQELSALAAKISTIKNGAGVAISGRPLRPNNIYRHCEGYPPDLIVYFDELSHRSSGVVGSGAVFMQTNDTGPDDANHDHNGFFVSARMRDLRSGKRKNIQVHDLDCLDVTPTLLKEYGLEPPEHLGGKILDFDSAIIRIANSNSILQPHNEHQTQVGLSLEEEEIVKSRLAELGYL